MLRTTEQATSEYPTWSRRPVGAISGAAVLVMCAVVAYAALTDVPVGLMVRDPNQVAQGRAWTGIVSTLGNGLWAMSAGVLALTILVGRPGLDSLARRPLVGLCALSTVLFLDDSLLLHDEVLPSIGVPEIAIMGCYGLAGLAVLVTSVPLLRSVGTLPMFLAALALFAVSVGVDLVGPGSWPKDLLFGVEDGAKFIGIGLWADVMLRTSRSLLK